MADTHSCDALVVGGGLAGGAVATLLAEAGRSVTLLERTHGSHDKVCGEFLSGEALHYLERLGVDVHALGALPITTLRFTRGARTVERPLPFPAMSLTRKVLDEALLNRSIQAGATVCRGASVQSLVRVDGGVWEAAAADGDRVRAPAAFLATGKHDLRGHARPAAPACTRHAGLLAFKAYFRVDPAQAAALRSAIEIYLFPHGYCGLQLVENGTANLGLLVQREHFRTWPQLLLDVFAALPLLAERLAAAAQTEPKPLALSHIPYGFRRATAPAGLWALGDQAAVIPSFSGDGMSIALHSGVLAAQSFLAGGTAPQFQRTLHRQLRVPLSLATLMSRALVGAPALAGTVALLPGAVRQLALRTRVPAVL